MDYSPDLAISNRSNSSVFTVLETMNFRKWLVVGHITANLNTIVSQIQMLSEF